MEAEQRLAIKETASRNTVLSPKPCETVPAAISKKTVSFLSKPIFQQLTLQQEVSTVGSSHLLKIWIKFSCLSSYFFMCLDKYHNFGQHVFFFLSH